MADHAVPPCGPFSRCSALTTSTFSPPLRLRRTSSAV